MTIFLVNLYVLIEQKSYYKNMKSPKFEYIYTVTFYKILSCRVGVLNNKGSTHEQFKLFP